MSRETFQLHSEITLQLKPTLWTPLRNTEIYSSSFTNVFLKEDWVFEYYILWKTILKLS